MKNQKGQILLITIMLVATVLTVVLAVTFKSTSETQITKLEEQSQKALTAAEAGIEAALQQESGSVSIGSLPGFSGSGFSGQASVESIRDSKFVSPLLLRDQQYTFYLADYPGFANPLSGYLAVYFQSEVECPALELTFLGSPGSGSSTPTLTPTPIPPTPTRTRTPTPAGPTPTRTPTPTATRTPTPQAATATPTPLPCVTSSTTWQNKTFTAQTGTFTTEFDATPSQNGVSHTYIGLSNGSASANSNIVAKIRFGSGGNIVAFDGTNSTGSISYLGGVTYHIRMVVNITTDTYDVYVTPQGQAEQTLATNLSFSSSVTQLNNRGIHTESTPGSVSICNFSAAGQVLGVTSTDITRRLIDPCGRISKPNVDLSTLPAGTYSLGGYSFVYKTQFIPLGYGHPLQNQALLIVRSLFASTRVGLELTGGGTLPVQGKYITSEAKTPSGVSRKVQLFQSYPQIPAEFFVTSF